jgi:hypothetical protein
MPSKPVSFLPDSLKTPLHFLVREVYDMAITSLFHFVKSLPLHLLEDKE